MLQTLFQIGEFEYSLVHAYQGYQKYRITFFKHGIYQGNETIEDCVGRNTSPKAFQLLSPWIRELVEHRKLLMETLKEEVDELAGTRTDRLMLSSNPFYLNKLSPRVKLIFI